MVSKIALSHDCQLSRLVYGYWRAAEWGHTASQTLDHIKYCMDLGITTFDHADIYGDYTCEGIFGQGLKLDPSIRQSMEIVTKCGIKLISANRPEHKIKYYDTSFDHIIWSAENALRELATDYIDVLLIHRPDPFNDPAETARAFEQLHRQGKVLHFGVSNFTIQQFKTLQKASTLPLVTNQLEISASCLDAFDDGNLAFCQEIDMKPMAWSPLGGGEIFTSNEEGSKRLRLVLEKVGQEIGAETIDQVLLSWLMAHPAGIIPILGTGKQTRILKAAQSCSLTMSRMQWFEILEASRGEEVP